MQITAAVQRTSLRINFMPGLMTEAIDVKREMDLNAMVVVIVY